MRMLTRKICSVAIASMLLVTPGMVCAHDTGRGAHDRSHSANGMAMTADVLIARPLGLVATICGAAFFLVGLPFIAMTGDISHPADRMIGEPGRYTFTRPLGDLANASAHRNDGDPIP
jgi:hypothetical protein